MDDNCSPSTTNEDERNRKGHGQSIPLGRQIIRVKWTNTTANRQKKPIKRVKFQLARAINTARAFELPTPNDGGQIKRLEKTWPNRAQRWPKACDHRVKGHRAVNDFFFVSPMKVTQSTVVTYRVHNDNGQLTPTLVGGQSHENNSKSTQIQEQLQTCARTEYSFYFWIQTLESIMTRR